MNHSKGKRSALKEWINQIPLLDELIADRGGMTDLKLITGKSWKTVITITSLFKMVIT